MTNQPLGPNQRLMLCMLAEKGFWHRRSKWHIDSTSTTEKILRSLLERGRVVKNNFDVWTLAVDTSDHMV